MSEEEGYIIITIEDNGDSTNDTKVVIIQDSETELHENMFSTDGTLTTQPDFQGSNGVDGLPVPGDQAVSQMSHLATLKRHSSNSLEVEFLLSHKRRRSSYPRGDYRGAAGPSVPEDQQETQPLTNSVGAPLQSAASPELQQPDLRQKPPIPKCPPAVPPALLPQGKPSLAQFPEAANCSTLPGNSSMDPHAASSAFCIPPSFVLKKCCLYEMMGKEETSLENNTKMTNCPPVLENDSGQDTSAYFFIPSSFGYLGDPKRNVRVLDAHLLTAQRKANPRHAVRYLIHILFSKKILTDGWVGVNSQGLRPLDANKMAALREHLQSVFPDYDLREYGNYWQTCIADINSLISCLRSEANTIRQKAGDNSKGPTNPDTPVAADLNGTRYGKGSESSSQLSQQAAASETRGNGNSQHNSSACPKGIKEYSTDNSLVSYEALEYLGNPDRNIQLPHSVLSMAKVKSRPELSAIYLIRNLFTEEVLIRSNIYGSLGHGLYALNPNRINALREFLGDAYPTCDLSESGYDWKLCVTAINSCIRSLRCDFKKSTSKA
uniref:BEN domain-containing protein n=1 Tax=Felis catus TaxID=9685 RepID=A0ABI7VXS2_FELCA